MINSIKALKELAFVSLQTKYPNVPTYAIPPQKYTDKTSNGLTTCVIHWIELNGYQAERINSQGKQIDNRTTIIDIFGNVRTIGSVTWVKGTTQNGTADISSTIKGRSVKIEIKCKATKDNKQSQAQLEYQFKIERSGGVYIIVRTFEDFFKWYHNFINTSYEE